MSRTWTTDKRSDGWVMYCDRCYKRTESRPTEHDFPLVEFYRKGWMIGRLTDACPECVGKGEKVGGPKTLEALEQDFEQSRAWCLKYQGREPLSRLATP